MLVARSLLEMGLIEFVVTDDGVEVLSDVIPCDFLRTGGCDVSPLYLPSDDFLTGRDVR